MDGENSCRRLNNSWRTNTHQCQCQCQLIPNYVIVVRSTDSSFCILSDQLKKINKAEIIEQISQFLLIYLYFFFLFLCPLLFMFDKWLNDRSIKRCESVFAFVYSSILILWTFFSKSQQNQVMSSHLTNRVLHDILKHFRNERFT